jgi:hypothetical protein
MQLNSVLDQHPFFQQIEVGPAEHLAFDEFKPGNLALNLTIAPLQL